MRLKELLIEREKRLTRNYNKHNPMEKELRIAFLNKERAELYLSNLERLHDDKTINDTTYNTLKSEYSAGVQQAQLKINQIKQELSKKLTLKTKELNIYKQELANLDARFKVGQLSADEFLKLSKKPDKRISELEEQIAFLENLLKSTHSSEIGTAEVQPSGFLSSIRGRNDDRQPSYGQLQQTAQLVSQPETKSEPSPMPPHPVNISFLQILPDRVYPGNTFGIVATLINSGTETIYHRAELKINNRIESYNDITLRPGQSEDITFTAIAGPPGDYHISVDNATGILRVLPA